MWINYAEGFLLVFAINDKESFNALKGKYDRIMKVKGSNCPIILVGNKCDYRDETKVNGRKTYKLQNMEKSKKAVLGITTIAGLLGGILIKSKVGKVISF